MLGWIVGEYDEEINGFQGGLELAISQEQLCLSCILLKSEF
jgi:hypothetical protein